MMARCSARRMAATTWQSMNLPHGVKDIYSLACG